MFASLIAVSDVVIQSAGGVFQFGALLDEVVEPGAGELESVEKGGSLLGIDEIVGEGAGDADDGELVGLHVFDEGEDAAAGVEVRGLMKDAEVATAARGGFAGAARVVNVLATRRLVHIKSSHK